MVDYTAAFLQAMISSYTKPALTSMLTDTNQANSSSLSSRTDDLHAVITIPGPTQQAPANTEE